MHWIVFRMALFPLVPNYGNRVTELLRDCIDIARLCIDCSALINRITMQPVRIKLLDWPA